MKKCSKCNIEKEFSEFFKDKHKNDGYYTICKSCRNTHKRNNRKYYSPTTDLELTCSKCELTKLTSEFHKNKLHATGYEKRCKSCRKEISKRDYNKRSDQIKVQTNIYYKNNKPKVREARKTYQKNRIKTDIKYKLIRNLRNRLYYALEKTSWKKNTHFYQYIGCSLEELKLHIEKQFLPNMSWENYGKWHIDHIKALSKANTEQELYSLCHYTNLQPLWAEDNLSKSNK